MNTQRYTDAFNEVKEYGSRNSAVRTANQTEIGLFWAYDRPGTGAPPVLFIENMVEIGNAIGNSPADNARMFAMASVILADAIIAGWDTKYEVDLWRPITGIRGAADDGNPNTSPTPLGVSGAPGAILPRLRRFHAAVSRVHFRPCHDGRSHFQVVGIVLRHERLRRGGRLDWARSRDRAVHAALDGSRRRHCPNYYVRFTQDGPLGPNLENSPEGENSMSRIYLGVHWRMDQEDGQALGRAVAQYVATNYFQAVPEPGTSVLMPLAA